MSHVTEYILTLPWVHDKYHWISSVDVCGYKLAVNRVFVVKVHLNEQPITVSTIKDTPVHPKEK